jgi:hypothetical protein
MAVPTSRGSPACSSAIKYVTSLYVKFNLEKVKLCEITSLLKKIGLGTLHNQSIEYHTIDLGRFTPDEPLIPIE